MASPLGRMLRATQTLIATLLLSAIAGSLLFLALSRQVVRRALLPLDALSRHLSALGASNLDSFVPGRRWDLQEIDEVVTSFDGLLARVRAAVGRERRFVADASHELRTPLTRLRGQLEVIDLEADRADVGASLKAARRSCDLLVRTTESLLALAREEVSASETVAMSEVAELVHRALLESDHPGASRLRLDAPDEGLVRGDATLLGLALGNLVDNALKYTSGVVAITVRDGAFVEVSVLDEGPGIEAHQLARLLEPFTRGPRTDVPGSGLGLSLASHVARAHGGALSLEARLPHGLACRLSLPPWRPRAAPSLGNH